MNLKHLFFSFAICLNLSFPSISAQTTPQTKVIEVPAEYQTITKKQLVKKKGFTDWVEVICEPKVTRISIQKVQIALKDLGYDVDVQGENAIIDSKTKKALVQFQKDYHAPVCGFPNETLRLLFEAQKKLKHLKELKK